MFVGQNLHKTFILLINLLVSLRDPKTEASYQPITYNSPPTFVKTPPSVVYALPDSPVNIACLAVGFPTINYAWLFDNKPAPWIQLVKHGGPLGLASSSSPPSIILSGVNDTTPLWYLGSTVGSSQIKVREGVYQCLAWNQFGKLRSSPMTLIIASAGEFVDKTSRQFIDLAPLQTVRLNCSASRGKPPAKISWMTRTSDGMRQFVGENRFLATDNDGNLYITAVNNHEPNNARMSQGQRQQTFICTLNNDLLNTIILGPELVVRFVQSRSFSPSYLIQSLYHSPVKQLVLINQTVTLKCLWKGDENLPINQWSWTRREESHQGPQLIGESNVAFRVRNDATELSIPTIREELAGSYSCCVQSRADITNLPELHCINFEVEVQGPPEFTVKPVNKIIPLHGSTSLECRAKSSLTRLEWLVNGRSIEGYLDGSNKYLKQDTIHLNNLSVSDTAVFQCRLSNQHGWSVANAFVHVWHFPPTFICPKQPSRPGSPVDQSIESVQGQSIELCCQSAGAPKADIEWSRSVFTQNLQGRQLESLLTGPKSSEEMIGSRYLFVSNGNLIIKRVTLTDAGFYACRAWNRFGSASRRIQLDIYRPTRILSGPVIVLSDRRQDSSMFGRHTDSFFLTRQGASIGLACNASASHRIAHQLRIVWLKDGSFFNEASINSQRIGSTQPHQGTSILRLNSLLPSDTGSYTCVARTELDNATASIKLVVQGPPSPPTDVSVHCSSSSLNNGGPSASIEWSGGSINNSPLRQLIIERLVGFYRPRGHQGQINATAHLVKARLMALTKVTNASAWQSILVNQQVHFGSLDRQPVRVQLRPDVVYFFRLRLVNELGSSDPSRIFPSPTTGDLDKLCHVKSRPVDRNVQRLRVYGTEPRQLTIDWQPIDPHLHNGPYLSYQFTITCLDCSIGPPKNEQNVTLITDWSIGKLTLISLATNDRVWTIEVFKTYQVSVMATNMLGSSLHRPLTDTGMSGEAEPALVIGHLAVGKIESDSVQLEFQQPSTVELKDRVNGYFRGYRVEWCRFELTSDMCQLYKVSKDYIVQKPPSWYRAELRSKGSTQELMIPMETNVLNRSRRQSPPTSLGVNPPMTPIEDQFQNQLLAKPRHQRQATIDQSGVQVIDLDGLPGSTKIKTWIRVINMQYAGKPSAFLTVQTLEGTPDAVSDFASNFVGVSHVELSWVKPIVTNGDLVAYDLEVYLVSSSAAQLPNNNVSIDRGHLVTRQLIRDPDQIATRISGLDMATNYLTVIWARTSSGRGKPSRLIVTTASRLNEVRPENIFTIRPINRNSINVTLVGSTHNGRDKSSSAYHNSMSPDMSLSDNEDQSSNPFKNLIAFYVQFRLMGQAFWEETRQENRQKWIVISNLISPNLYELRVVLVNSSGQSHVSRERRFTLPIQASTSGDQQHLYHSGTDTMLDQDNTIQLDDGRSNNVDQVSLGAIPDRTITLVVGLLVAFIIFATLVVLILGIACFTRRRIRGRRRFHVLNASQSRSNGSALVSTNGARLAGRATGGFHLLSTRKTNCDLRTNTNDDGIANTTNSHDSRERTQPRVALISAYRV